MEENAKYTLELSGCNPDPLMSYLKALGILRLVSEQKDSKARGWWKNDVFWLHSPALFKDADTEEAKRDALVKFFLEEYEPTPIVVPWSGGDFFDVNWKAKPDVFKKAPTASKAIEAILTTTTPRFEPYRKALHTCEDTLKTCKIDTKEKMEKQKWAFIQALRSTCEERGVIEWMDAAAVGTVERFAPLLGSGGGSDGNTHFSDNFMQNLWDALPDFDNQRQQRKGSHQSASDTTIELLNATLFGSPTDLLIEKRTSSLYDSGAVGGPNASQGMERNSLTNPWNFILGLEGTICFAGAATKRLVADASSNVVFPFQVTASVTLSGRMADKEQAGKEIWLPLWRRPSQANEVFALLREGRAQCGSRPVSSGVDMARAVAMLGVDRGILEFHRYAIVKGRVGGDNYNTAAYQGRFEVRDRPDADLLLEIDPWLDRFRAACRDKNTPPRFISALRAIESAIFEFCKYGGKPLFQDILVALGRGEREMALTEGKIGRSKTNIKPLSGLSSDWVKAADDGSPEFAVARALVSINDPKGKIGPLRANLEPVKIWYDKQEEKQKGKWAEKDRTVVWNSADLATNLANVLQRRMMDGSREGKSLPLASHFSVSLDAIAAFLHGELDDQRTEDLLWGLMLVENLGGFSSNTDWTNDLHIPRVYALLKLLFLPRPLVIESGADGTPFARMLRKDETGGIVIRPEPSILSLINAGRLGEAYAIAMRRLRASGLNPMPRPIRGRGVRDGEWRRELDMMGNTDIDPRRLAAALLIPINDNAVDKLFRLVIGVVEMDYDLTIAPVNLEEE